MDPFSRLKEKRFAWKNALCTPLNHTGGAAALTLRARLISAQSLWIAAVIDVLSPSLRAHIGVFGSAAAAKCVIPATMDPFSRLKRKTLCLGGDKPCAPP